MDTKTERERPRPLPSPIAHHTSLALFKLAGWIQTEMDRALESKNIKTKHYRILSILAHMGPWSQLAAGRKLLIDRATMVALVDDLERLGLAERQRNPEDRREYRLQITEAGRLLVKEAEEAVGAMEEALFSPLSPPDRAQLHDLLSRLFAEPAAI